MVVIETVEESANFPQQPRTAHPLGPKMVAKKTSALSATSGLLVTLMSLAVCGISVYILVVSIDVRLAIGESVSDGRKSVRNLHCSH